MPNAPEIFLESEGPEIGIQLQTAVAELGDDAYEVTLTTTVTAKLGEEKTVFLVEVGQAGIFRVRNVPEDNLAPLLSLPAPFSFPMLAKSFPTSCRVPDLRRWCSSR